MSLRYFDNNSNTLRKLRVLDSIASDHTVILILHRWLRVESIRKWTVDTSIAAQSSACTEACKFQERRRLELLPAILGHPRARKLLVSRSTGTNASNYERSKILRSCSDSSMQPPLSRAFPLHLREIHWKQLRRFHGRAYPFNGPNPRMDHS